MLLTSAGWAMLSSSVSVVAVNRIYRSAAAPIGLFAVGRSTAYPQQPERLVLVTFVIVICVVETHVVFSATQVDEVVAH